MIRRKITGTEKGTPEEFRYKSVKELIEDGFFETPNVDDDSKDDDIERELEESREKSRLLLEQIRDGKIQGKISY